MEKMDGIKVEKKNRNELKQEFVILLRKVLDAELTSDTYLLLQYGSALIGAETDFSDFDLILTLNCDLATKTLGIKSDYLR